MNIHAGINLAHVSPSDVNMCAARKWSCSFGAILKICLVRSWREICEWSISGNILDSELQAALNSRIRKHRTLVHVHIYRFSNLP